jgi:hypothetical protein
MSLIPGILPSGACYGTPQELLDLFAQYLTVPAFAVSSKVLYSATSPMPNTDFVWVDTAGSTTPLLKLYNEIIGGYEEYPFQGQLSPAGAETLISGKSAITSLASSDLFLVSQAGTSAVLKKITFSNLAAAISPGAGSITYPMLSTSVTETDNVARRVAKAWINFNGTGVIAIRDDFRCTTIADNGTGAYTVNWETGTFPDADYCVVANGGVQAATVEITLTSVAAGSIGVFSAGFGSNAQDAAVMCAVAFD